MAPDHPVRLWPAIDVIIVGDADDAEERLLLAIDDLDASALEPRGALAWRVHFASSPDVDLARRTLRMAFGDALQHCEPTWVSDEAWAARSQEALRAVRVGRFTIAPPWDVPAPAPDTMVIQVEPSTGFGTGHHQSTRLCLTVLDRLEMRGRSLLDVGTGSGVLAMAGALLGATPVVGLDIDADACRAAIENVARNGLAGAVRIECADIESSTRTAEVVVANLTADVHERHARRLRECLCDGGTLVLGGIMNHQAAYVAQTMAPLALVAEDVEDDWMALTFRGNGRTR